MCKKTKPEEQYDFIPKTGVKNNTRRSIKKKEPLPEK